MRTEQEIQTEIRALKAVRSKIIPNNPKECEILAAIDAQVQVLEGSLNKADVDALFAAAYGISGSKAAIVPLGVNRITEYCSAIRACEWLANSLAVEWDNPMNGTRD